MTDKINFRTVCYGMFDESRTQPRYPCHRVNLCPLTLATKLNHSPKWGIGDLIKWEVLPEQRKLLALLRLVWVAGHSDLTQVVMGSPDWTTNGEVGSWVNLPATR